MNPDPLRDLDERNTQEHQELRELVSDLKLSVHMEVERVAGSVRSHRLVAMVVWAILGVAVVVTGSMVNRGIDFLEKMSNAVVEIDRRQSSWEPYATEWGENLEDADKALKDRMQEHERRTIKYRLGCNCISYSIKSVNCDLGIKYSVMIGNNLYLLAMPYSAIDPHQCRIQNQLWIKKICRWPGCQDMKILQIAVS